MIESNFIILIHIITSLVMIGVLVTGFNIVKKFKGGILSKFYSFIIIGSLPIIIYHLLEFLSFFNISLIPEEDIGMVIEHITILFLFASIFVGVIYVYNDYKHIKVPLTK